MEHLPAKQGPSIAMLDVFGVQEKARELMEGILFEGLGLDRRRVAFVMDFKELGELPELQVIVTCGKKNIQRFTQDNVDSIMTAVNTDFRYPDPEHGPQWVVPCMHPATALSQGVAEGSKDGNITLVSIVVSLQRAFYYMEGLPFYEEET